MATIVLTSAQVIKAAHEVINAIEIERSKRDEASIAYTMRPRKFCGFTLKRRSREQAIKYLTEYSDIFGWQSIYAYRDLDKAKGLLKLAKHGDPVTLNEDDVRVLF